MNILSPGYHRVDLYLFNLSDRLADIARDGWRPPVLTGWQQLRAYHTLSGYFGSPWSFADGWLVFGPEQGCRIDIIGDESSPTVVARFDTRSESVQFTTSVCRLAEQLGCQLFLPAAGAIVTPHLAALNMALADLRAHAPA